MLGSPVQVNEKLLSPVRVRSRIEHARRISQEYWQDDPLGELKSIIGGPGDLEVIENELRRASEEGIADMKRNVGQMLNAHNDKM